MIMRITWGKVHPGKWDEYEQVYRQAVVGQSKGIAGLVARWLVQDVEDHDAGYSVSIWDSAESLKAYEDSDLVQGIQGQLRPFFPGEFRTNRCEVKVIEEFK